MPPKLKPKSQSAEKAIPVKRLSMAIIIPFLEKYGGAERYAIECVRYWQDAHDITIYATRISQTLLMEHGIGEQVKCQLLTAYYEDEHSMLLNALLLPKIWREEIARHDVYHAHLWPSHLVGVHPMVWFPHEPLRVLHDLRYEQDVTDIGKNAARNVHIYPKYNYDRIGNHVYDAYLNAIDAMDKAVKPDRIVANSSYTAKYLEEVYGGEVTDYVYPGVTPEMFVTLPTDPNLFVTISQLWQHKRVNLLIEAMALTDNAQLVIIGSGPEKERLQDLAAKLGVGDRVFFLSGLSNRELGLVLSRACAFLFSPIKEPFGIVVLEAMAAGKPIVAVNEGGYAEVCTPDAAFLVPAFPSAIAEKITYLQNNSEIGQKMGAAGRKIAARYTWKRAADELEAIIVDTWRRYEKANIPRLPVVGNMLLGIQYYLWFGDGYGEAHWSDNQNSGYVGDKPLLGYYGSSKGQTINYHFDIFDKMGLDYVVLNLHVTAEGPNPIELVAIQHAFDIASTRNCSFRLAVQICPYADDINNITTVVAMIEKLHAWKDCYFTMDNKPVLFWFWSGAYDGNKNLFDALKTSARNFINCALSLRLPRKENENRLTFGFFDSFAPFSPLELAGESNWETVWSEAYKASQSAEMPYLMATISPGYDDTALTDPLREGNPYRKIERGNGKTLARGFEFIENLDIVPRLVMISTFNEFHENTHIEPSTAYGNFYVDKVEAFVRKMKQNKNSKSKSSE